MEEEGVPPTLEKYQFKVFPLDAAAVKAVAVAFWQ